MDILVRLKQLMEEYGWSEYRLAKNANLSQSTVTNIFRRNSAPSFSTLSAICQAFNITLAQFFSDGKELIELTTEQKALLLKWSMLNEEQKALLLRVINLIKDKNYNK